MKDIVEMMKSPDYKERFKAEYIELSIRKIKLRDMLEKYKAGTLDFKPSCSYDLLHEQYIYMNNYAKVLETRAKIENIDLQYTLFVNK
jgi:hypothetical protein